MLGLVSAEKTGGLNLGRRSSRKFLVEADDTLHTNGIGSSADGLVDIRQLHFVPSTMVTSSSYII